MSTTINISLPEKLKKQAQELVNAGIFVSFSDLVRSSLRETVKKSKYDIMLEKAIKEAEEDLRQGKGILLKNKKDIDNYFKSL